MDIRLCRSPRQGIKKAVARYGRFVTWALLGLLLNSVALADMRFTSPSQQVQLIELYTSEGCSSCPPADRWLSRLRDNPALWQQVIPVSFHVDYWDYIGWPDRFADRRFSQRQRQHHRQGNIRQVYTPGFVVDGKEWRGWYARRSLPERTAQPGPLQLVLDGSHFSARFSGVPGASRLTIALLGAGLSTEVKAGENKGERLEHDFVVLALADYAGEGNHHAQGRWQGQLPQVARQHKPGQLAIAAWVSRPDSLIPIQAVGGWLEAP